MLPTDERFRGPPYSYSPHSVPPMNATISGLQDPRSAASGAAPPVDVSGGSGGMGANPGGNTTDDQLSVFTDCISTDCDVESIERVTFEQPAAKRQKVADFTSGTHTDEEISQFAIDISEPMTAADENDILQVVNGERQPAKQQPAASPLKVGDSTLPPSLIPPPSGMGEVRAAPPAIGASVSGLNQRVRSHSLEVPIPMDATVMNAADVSARMPPPPRRGREGPFAFTSGLPRRAMRVEKDVAKDATKAKNDGTGQTDTAAPSMAMSKKALIEGQPALRELRAILAKTEGGFAEFQRVFEEFKHSISARRNDLGVTKVRASKRENRRGGTICAVLDEKIIPAIGDHVGRSEKYYSEMYPSLPEQDMATMVRRTINDALEDNIKCMEGLSKGIPLAAISSCPDRTAWIKQYVMSDMWSMLTDDVYRRIHMCIYGKSPTKQAQKK